MAVGASGGKAYFPYVFNSMIQELLFNMSTYVGIRLLTCLR